MTVGRSDHFIQRLRVIVQQHGDRPAVCLDGRIACSYDQLWRWSGRIAVALQRRGVTPGATVALLLSKSPEYMAAMLGVWRC